MTSATFARAVPSAAEPLPPEVSAALHSVVLSGWVFTVEGVIADVNDKLCRLTGYARAELVGLSAPFPFWVPQETAGNWVAVQRTRSQIADEIEMEIVHKAGHRLMIAFTARPLRAADGSLVGLVSVMKDLSAERARAVELQESQRLLDAAQQQAALGSWAWSTGSGGGSMLWSRQMYTLLGVQPGGPASFARFLGAVHPDDAERYGRLVAIALQHGGTFVAEHRVVRPDGEVRHVHGTAEVTLGAQGQPVQIRGSAQDVTERVLREQELRASQELFRLTLESSPIGLALVDLTGRFTTVNAALCRIVGRDESELLTLTFAQITHPDDLDADLSLLTALTAGEIPEYQLDKRYLYADGREVWTSLHVVLIRDDDGAPLHYVAQIVDIDDRRRAAERLRDQARSDPLTGLANRRAWQQDLFGHLAAVHAGERPLAVAILDLDNFKVFNDTFGHPVGDRLLVTTAADWVGHLAQACPQALLARIGGEEFAVALPGLATDRARTVIEQLLALVGRGQTASAGLTAATEQDQPSSLMTRADAALYMAKRQGRNRCQTLLSG